MATEDAYTWTGLSTAAGYNPAMTKSFVFASLDDPSDYQSWSDARLNAVLEKNSNNFTTDSGGTLALVATLNTQPQGDVKYAVTTSEPAHAYALTESVLLTPENWNIGIPVIWGTESVDMNTESIDVDVLFGLISADDPYYKDRGDHVVPIVHKPTYRNLNITVASGSNDYTTAGGGEVELDVVLTQQPRNGTAVTFVVSTNDPTTAFVQYPSTLTFTKETWNVPQVVVQGVYNGEYFTKLDEYYGCTNVSCYDICGTCEDTTTENVTTVFQGPMPPGIPRFCC